MFVVCSDRSYDAENIFMSRPPSTDHPDDWLLNRSSTVRILVVCASTSTDGKQSSYNLSVIFNTLFDEHLLRHALE